MWQNILLMQRGASLCQAWKKKTTTGKPKEDVLRIEQRALRGKRAMEWTDKWGVCFSTKVMSCSQHKGSGWVPSRYLLYLQCSKQLFLNLSELQICTHCFLCMTDTGGNLEMLHLRLTVSSIFSRNKWFCWTLTNLSSLLTECLHQQLNAGCVGCQSWTYSRVDAHVRQHPDQLHQHVIILLHTHRRGRRPAGGIFPRGCVRWVASALVAVVQL